VHIDVGRDGVCEPVDERVTNRSDAVRRKLQEAEEEVEKEREELRTLVARRDALAPVIPFAY
jgi:hypothetical protein